MTDTEIRGALRQLEDRGWARIAGVYPEELMLQVKAEFADVAGQFEAIQRRKGIAGLVANATHHTLVLCRGMLALLEENRVSPLLEAWFGGRYILSTMGLSQVPPRGGVYTQRIHRDVRSFTGGARLWLNTLVMLDDSTPDNGATWMLEGSHKQAPRPGESGFYERAVRATGRRGDVLVFDGHIWHAAGENRTDAARQIITPIYCRPFIKQQLDYPRAFGYDFGRTLSPHLRQVLGYNALVPATLDEFYQKDEDRFYRSDQG